MNKIHLKGIVATGHSLSAAISNYTQSALGKGVTVQVDRNNIAFVARASDAETTFNPATGDMDLTSNSSLLNRLSFKSTSAEVNSNVFHAVCSTGCGSHLLADNKSMLQFCPLCTSAISSEVDEVSTDEVPEDDAEIVDATEDEDELVAADDDDDAASTDPIVVAGTSLSDALDIYRTKLEARGVSISADSDEQVNYVVCSSAACGAHIVHDQRVTVGQCPACLSATEDVDPDTVIDVSGTDPDHDLNLEDDEDTGTDTDTDDADGNSTEIVDDDEDEDDTDTSVAAPAPDDEDVPGDEDIAAVASSFSAARSLYLKKKTLVSTSGTTDFEPEYIVCSSAACGAHIIADKHLAKCPVCMSATTDPVDGLGEDDTITDKKVADETGSTSDDIVVEDDTSDDDTSGDDVSTSAVQIVRRKVSVSEDAELSADDAVSDETSDDDETSDEDTGNALSITDDSGKDLSAETTEVDALSYVSDSATHDSLDVSFSSSVGGSSAWTAYCDGVPVAMARVATAGNNADVFHTERFGQAVIATAKVAGVRKALTEMGFVGIRHKVSVSAEVSKLVDEKVAADKAAIETTKTEHEARLQQALSTSIIGLNRNFFAGKPNPLKAALYSAMNSAGIANPEVIIDQCFSKHHDTWLQGVFSQAREILAKPVEVQEALSKTIVETNYQPVSASSVSTTIESRLAGMGTSVSSVAAPAVVQTAPVAQPAVRSEVQRRVLDSLGGGR